MSWVFCAGMIRSGSTLQYQLASSIIEHAGLGRRVKYVPEANFDAVLRDNPGNAELKVFKAHICTSSMADLCHCGSAVVLYCYRDIRDVAVSALRKFNMSFESLVEAQWLDQAISDFNAWTMMPRVLVSRYEAMVGNIGEEASRISGFLGTEISSGEVLEIAAQYSVPAQQERIKSLRQRHPGTIAVDDIVFDDKELLHHNHIHKGEIGAWRSELSPAQQHFLTDRYKSWLVSAGYGCE